MSSVEQLKASRLVWTANESAQPKAQAYTFEQAGLDRALQGGLAPSGLTFLRSFTGMGELTLFAPVLRQSVQKNAYIALINPPGIPNLHWFSAHVCESDKLFYIKSQTSNEHLWAFEQCIMSGICAAVIAWDMTAAAKQLRRCHIRALQHNCLAICIQASSANHSTDEQIGSCSTDLYLHRSAQQWCVDINKQQGGWPKQNIPISHPLPLSNSAINHALQQPGVLVAING